MALTLELPNSRISALTHSRTSSPRTPELLLNFRTLALSNSRTSSKLPHLRTHALTHSRTSELSNFFKTPKGIKEKIKIARNYLLIRIKDFDELQSEIKELKIDVEET